MDEEVQLYKIVRHYHPSLNKENETVEENLTLAEAQAWCEAEFSHKENEFFDGYYKE